MPTVNPNRKVAILKAHIAFWHGQWWCRRMGVTGCGATPAAAYYDMVQLYVDAIKPKTLSVGRVRQG